MIGVNYLSELTCLYRQTRYYGQEKGSQPYFDVLFKSIKIYSNNFYLKIALTLTVVFICTLYYKKYIIKKKDEGKVDLSEDLRAFLRNLVF